MVFSFGDCEFDIDARRLVRAHRAVHLSPKAFDLLRILIEGRPRAFSKAELLERIWPGTFVSDSSLARAVTEIRQAVGAAERDAGAIRTVHGFGYAFAADVVERGNAQAGDARHTSHCWWLVSGDRTFALSDGCHVAGRDPQAAISLQSPHVSRHHAEIQVRDGVVTVRDLGSKNGTYVRGAKIAAAMPVEAGDEIQIGSFTLVVRKTLDGLTETDAT